MRLAASRAKDPGTSWGMTARSGVDVVATQEARSAPCSCRRSRSTIILFVIERAPWPPGAAAGARRRSSNSVMRSGDLADASVLHPRHCLRRDARCMRPAVLPASPYEPSKLMVR